TLTNRIRINTLALSARLPTIYGVREFVEAGGLMSYGPNFLDLYRRSASYVDKILRGTKPADIPVEQPTKFDFIINLLTAKAPRSHTPPLLSARAAGGNQWMGGGVKNKPPPPKFSAFGRRCSRPAGRVADRMGASLSDAAGEDYRIVCGWWPD